MQSHPRELGVQMAATACIYNLTKAEMGKKIHPQWLAAVVKLTMNAMENFPNHQQVLSVHFFYEIDLLILQNIDGFAARPLNSILLKLRSVISVSFHFDGYLIMCNEQTETAQVHCVLENNFKNMGCYYHYVDM